MSEEQVPVEPVTPVPAPAVDDVLVIRLARRERRVTVEDEQGIAKTYAVREMMGNSRDQWLNGMAKRMKLDKNGAPVGVAEFGGLQASLIARCLYDDQGKLVTEAVIAQWPASAQKALFEVCQDLSGLTDKTKEELAKNS